MNRVGFLMGALAAVLATASIGAHWLKANGNANNPQAIRVDVSGGRGRTCASFPRGILTAYSASETKSFYRGAAHAYNLGPAQDGLTIAFEVGPCP